MIQELNGSILEEKGIQVFIKREDLFFPEIPGNKWRKLKYNLDFAKEEGHQHIVSFGGAFSNHISALASAGRIFDLKTTGIIRGERTASLNSTLLKAQAEGMDLQFVSRSKYKHYTQGKDWSELESLFPEAYFIPEGGTNMLALKGCAEIITEETDTFDVITCSVGTGGTISGILLGLDGDKKVLGFPALKADFLQNDINRLTEDYLQKVFYNYELITEYHFGGYAKHNRELVAFMSEFYAIHEIPLDPIYTGKMMFGLFDMIQKDFFARGTRILAIHTGGLQGIAGFNSRFGTQLADT